MTKREPDLDRITTLLGQCLGRIDEQAYRLQHTDDEPGFDTSDVLENEAATLQELVSTMIDAAAPSDRCDLNRVVEHAVQSCLTELALPIVLRQRLAPDLPRIACGPGELAFAVQRALVIAMSRMQAGCEIIVTTRSDDESIVLEIESHGAGRDRHLRERTQTLCEFVAGFRGNCRIDDDQRGALLIVLELPQALVIDEY